MITFKQFSTWADARTIDLNWSQIEAIESLTICEKYNKYPFFLREYIWKHSTEGDHMDSLYTTWQNNNRGIK